MLKPQLKIVGPKFKHFSHPRKIQILNYIMNNKNRVAVSSIYRALKLEQSVTSSFLSQLRKDKIVKAKKDGRKVFYSVDQKRIEALTQALLTSFTVSEN